jgi:hypothetical protein
LARFLGSCIICGKKHHTTQYSVREAIAA